MAAIRIFGGLVGLAFYVAAGLAFHLIAHGEVDWNGAFVYVAMAFWPVLLAWEVVKILGLIAVVVMAGLGLYFLVRGSIGRFRRRV